MDYLEALAQWESLQETLKELKAEEMALRDGLFNGTFPDPVEGTNTYTLPDGRVVKGVYKLNRVLDHEALEALVKEKKVTKKSYDAVRKVTYSLDLKAFHELPDRQRSFVEHAITVKPGAPTLSVVGPV